MELIKSDTRGGANHGWLQTRFSFSFSGYYNPERIHFGALRVLNDDFIDGGGGFPMHPHDNMEIITIPFTGALEHKDNMGHHGIIKAGDIQVMSAGTGVFHSEYNHSKTEPVTLFQLWIMPNKQDVKPRYEQISPGLEQRKNQLQQIVSPLPEDDGAWIHQDAWLHLGNFDDGFNMTYENKRKENGTYLIVIQGSLSVNDTVLDSKDAISTPEAGKLNLKALLPETSFLLIDIPLKW